MTAELPAPILAGNSMFSVGNGQLKAVGYAISAAAKRLGGSLFNRMAEVKRGDAGATPPAREDWNRVADSAEFIDYFRDFRFE